LGFSPEELHHYTLISGHFQAERAVQRLVNTGFNFGSGFVLQIWGDTWVITKGEIESWDVYCFVGC
jgi:hypothetical protein